MKHIVVIISLTIVSPWALGQEVRLGLPLGHSSWVKSAVYSPDGQTLVTASADKTAIIWDTQTGNVLNVLLGHTVRVNSAVYHPDGQTLVTASGDETAIIWDVQTGNVLKRLEGHSNVVWSAVYSPDGETLVTASWDGTAIIWDAQTGTVLHRLEGHTAMVNSADYSPDGQTIVTASGDNTAIIWDAKTGKLLHRLEGHTDYVYSAVYHPDGQTLVTASVDETAIIWDVQTGNILHRLKGHTDNVYSAVYSPDGLSIVTASGDGTAIIWDTETGNVLHLLVGHSWDVNSAVFSPDGQTIVTASWDKTTIIWDAGTGNVLHRLEGHTDDVNTAVYNPDGQTLVTASEDRTAIIWDAKTSNVLHLLEGHTAMVNSAVYSPNGQTIVTASSDASSNNTTVIWDARTGNVLHRLEGHNFPVNSAVYSPDGQSLVTASFDDTAIIWDAQTGNVLHRLKGHTFPVNSAVYSPDGQTVVTASMDRTAIIWDAQTGKVLHRLEGHTGSVYTAVYHPDGRTLVTASGDGTAIIWDAQSGNVLHRLEGHSWNEVNSAVFRPDGLTIVTASDDKTAIIWDAQTGKVLHRLEGHTDDVNSAVYSPDGQTLLSSSWDNTAIIWDAQTGKVLHRLEGHTRNANSAVFSPDGQTLVTASYDGSIIFWDVVKGKMLIQHFIFDGDLSKWLHLHPDGFFDASSEAMELMYWTKGLEVIDFDQLKERYWIPGLWEKVMKGEPLPKTRGIGQLKLQPELELGDIVDSTLPIVLTKRDGGYGEVSIFINGKEVIQDARGGTFDTTATQQTIHYSIADHPYLVEGENTITVKSRSADGFVQGRGTTTVYNYQKKKSEPVDFYGIVIGVGDYLNDAINLSFTEKDAESISRSIALGAENLFGEDRTHVYTITTNGGILPTKENIERVFSEVAEQASSEDMILVYLSGHGITWGSDDINGEFYFLTSEASTTNKQAFGDAYIRNSTAISTTEWIAWINAIPATKQVMIIDACASGKAVDNLIASRDVEASQLKAIDRMKDRTGMYIISGCAADAVSYEASQYGQGLLTYSILQGMKGAALRENQYVDVSTILQFARDQVPKLAEGIGGIQRPQLLIPKGGSFDIGILDSEDREEIPLAEPKQVYVRTNFINAETFEDDLRLTLAVNNELALYTSKGEYSDIIFFDAAEYANACKLSGLYTLTEAGIELNFKVRCGDDLTSYSVEGKTSEELISIIIELL